MRFRTLLPVVLIAVAGSACGPTAPADEADDSVPDRDTFIEVYLALRRAHATAPDSAAFEAEKERILERHDASAAALGAFLRRHADDADFIADLWETIGTRLTTPDTVSTVVGDSAGESDAVPTRATPSKPVPGVLRGRTREDRGPPEIPGRPPSR